MALESNQTLFRPVSRNMNEPQLKRTTQRRLTDRPLEEMWLTESRLGEARLVIRLFEAAARFFSVSERRIEAFENASGKTLAPSRDLWGGEGRRRVLDNWLCPRLSSLVPNPPNLFPLRGSVFFALVDKQPEKEDTDAVNWTNRFRCRVCCSLSLSLPLFFKEQENFGNWIFIKSCNRVNIFVVLIFFIQKLNKMQNKLEPIYAQVSRIFLSFSLFQGNFYRIL